jgi:hypothetical protein
VCIKVLAWVGGLILEMLDEVVEADCEQNAKEWSHPVDPVVAWELVIDDTRSKGASRIERACE